MITSIIKIDMDAALQALTLDQIRLFIYVAEEGSFSAAARKLKRAQSAVSYGIANLERILDNRLFDRSSHRPVLTEIGRSLLPDARRVMANVGTLRARAAAVSEGLELDVQMAIAAICPARLLIDLAHAFQSQFPTVEFRIEVAVLEAVTALVLDGTCSLGISGPIRWDASGLERRFLADVPMAALAASGHALASVTPPISRTQLHGHVQIVLSQRTGWRSDVDHGVLSDTTWRVTDAAMRLALIRAGLGWGNLPLHLVGDELARGSLVQLTFEEWGPDPFLAPLSSIVCSDRPPGPAGQWLLNELPSICENCATRDYSAMPP